MYLLVLLIPPFVGRQQEQNCLVAQSARRPAASRKAGRKDHSATEQQWRTIQGEFRRKDAPILQHAHLVRNRAKEGPRNLLR